MPRHLLELFSQPIHIQRKNSSGEWQSLVVSIQEAFNICDVEAFISSAEAVIKLDQEANQDLEETYPKKIKKNTNVDDVIMPCSFLRMEDPLDKDKSNIYVVSKDVVGEGNFGRVKLALRIDSPLDLEIYTVKIQKTNPVHWCNQLINRESRVGYMIGFFISLQLQRTDGGKEHNEIKYYNISRYAGITLSQWIKEVQPSDEDRLAVAIQLCDKINVLHFSKNRTHGDIKLDNVLIKPNTHEVTLIDFAFSSLTSTPNNEVQLQGSFLGLPYFPEDPEDKKVALLQARMQQMGVVHLDAFALKRLLAGPFKDEDYLFSDLLVKETNRFINSHLNPPPDFISVQTPLALLAYLILYRYKETLPTQLSLFMQQAISSIEADPSLTFNRKQALISQLFTERNNVLTPTEINEAKPFPHHFFPSPIASNCSLSGMTADPTPVTPVLASSPSTESMPHQQAVASPNIRLVQSFSTSSGSESEEQQAPMHQFV